jgi:predicted nucleotidyltransferase
MRAAEFIRSTHLIAEGTQLSPNMSVSPNQDPNSPEDWDYHYKGQQIKPGDKFHPEIKDLHLRQIDPTYDAFRNAFDNPAKPGPAVPEQPPQGDTIIPSRPVPPEKIKGSDGVPLKLKDIMQQDPAILESNHPGKPVTDAILKVMPVAQEIWFHGSRATGKHRKNSDTDILVIVPDDLVGDQYLGVVRILQKLSAHFDNHDIQPARAGSNIHRVAQEEGHLLWSNRQDVDENTAAGINKMFNNLGDPVFANLQRVALLAMQGRQSEAAGRLQTVIKDADPAVQKKIVDAVNNIKPVTINGRVADSSTLDKSKSHQDWILNTFIPWVQSLLGQQGVAENFADGRNPQDKGDSKRHGINTKASVSSLRKTAKSGGRKGQLAHWLANMKSGRAKAKKKTNEAVIGNLHFPQLTIAVDDHAIDRTRTRGISPATIDLSLKKLNAVADQLAQIEPNAQVWAYDAENNLGLGLRRISSKDMLFKLKTVIASKPYDGVIPIIELS